MKHANLIWFEIPVKNMDRAIRFYSEVLQIKIEKKNLYHVEYGHFDRNKIGVGGCLVERPEAAGKGVSLFFYVNVLSDAIKLAVDLGGKVVTPKTLLKQVDANGNTILAENLIDNQIGYYAELLDSEENPLSLYSHH